MPVGIVHLMTYTSGATHLLSYVDDTVITTNDVILTTIFKWFEAGKAGKPSTFLEKLVKNGWKRIPKFVIFGWNFFH